MAKYVLLVLTNPVEGKEEAYNDWYTNTHLGDLLKVPGVISAQRFKLTDAQLGPAPHPYSYLALYDIEIDDAQTTISALRERIGTPAMVMSDAMSPQLIGLTFEPITPRVTPKH